MDPFTLMALAKGAQSIGTGVTDYVGAEQAFGQSQEERLKELQRREELGTLGYSSEEQNVIMRQLLNPVQARERQRALETRQILGSGDLGASQAAITGMIQADKGEAARAGAAETFLQEQMAEKRLQEKELRDLEKERATAEAAKTQAVLSALTGGIAGQIEVASRRALYNEMKYGQAGADAAIGGKPLSMEDFNEALEAYGFTPGG